LRREVAMKRVTWRRAVAVLVLSACVLGGLGSVRADLVWKDGWPVVTRMKPGETDGANFQPEIAQYLLRSHGFAVKADGNFGAQTIAAVRRFQHSRGLSATGVLSAPTWRKLIVTVKQGSRGDAVRAVQVVLHDVNPKLPIDGIFGPSTRRAVEKWQRDEKLKPDGVVGAATWRTLLMLSRDV